LIFILIDLSSKYSDLLIKLLRLFLKFIYKSVQREIPFFSLNKIFDEFIKVFNFCLFNNFIKHLCIFLHFLFRYQTNNLIIDFSFLNPFFLNSRKLLFSCFSLKIFLLELNLFLFFLFQSFLLSSLLKYFIINILHILIKLSFFLLSLFDQISKLFRCFLSIRISIIGYINNQSTFILLIFEINGQLFINFLEHNSLSPQSINLLSQQFVLRNDRIVLLIRLIESIFILFDFFEQSLMLFLRCNSIHFLLLFKYFSLKLSDLFV